LLNYPYDYDNVIHPDDDWMTYVYRKWADDVHDIDPTMMTDQSNGIVRGYVWYEVEGSRMDYVTYHKNMREVTFEATSTKLVAGSYYPELWDVYHTALLNYIEQVTFGINGTVVSSVGATPIIATIIVLDHDNDQSFIYSKETWGDFYRPIAGGTYDLEFSADGYITHVEEGVVVQNDAATVLNIVLTPEGSGLKPYQMLSRDGIRIMNSGRNVIINIDGGAKSYQAYIHDVAGKKIVEFSGKNVSESPSIIWNGIDNTGASGSFPVSPVNVTPEIG